MGLAYFFDTYVFHAMMAGNPNYEKFKRGISIILTKLNLMELYYGLLLKYNQKVAELCYNSFVKYAVDITDDIIKQAMQFRFLNKKKNLSYVDCIGYITSKQYNVKFLTGDPAFKDLENVEFVE